MLVIRACSAEVSKGCSIRDCECGACWLLCVLNVYWHEDQISKCKRSCVFIAINTKRSWMAPGRCITLSSGASEPMACQGCSFEQDGEGCFRGGQVEKLGKQGVGWWMTGTDSLLPPSSSLKRSLIFLYGAVRGGKERGMHEEGCLASGSPHICFRELVCKIFKLSFISVTLFFIPILDWLLAGPYRVVLHICADSF